MKFKRAGRPFFLDYPDGTGVVWRRNSIFLGAPKDLQSFGIFSVAAFDTVSLVCVFEGLPILRSTSIQSECFVLECQISPCKSEVSNYKNALKDLQSFGIFSVAVFRTEPLTLTAA